MLTLDKTIQIKGDALDLRHVFQVPSMKPWRASGTVTRFLSGSGYLPLKRIIDICLSFCLLPAAALIIFISAVLIKLDSAGAVFYLQDRTGKGGKRFKMYKLRTMIPEADVLKEKYSDRNTQSYPDFKIPDDPRITRIGRFFRKTSLDEIPQIFNVLGGTMSLVGPRPTSFASSTYALWHTARLEVKPGLTGLWQVSGRCGVDFADRNRLDIAYLQNISLWLDIKILFRTVGTVLRFEGAE